MARKSVGMPSPSGGGGKWAIIAVIATSPIGVFFMVPLVMMLIIGISVSVVSGTTAGMLGTDEVQGAGSGCTIGGTTGQQSDHVRTVIGVAKAMNISKKGAIIATMTMLAETGIQNIANDGITHGSEDGASTRHWLDVAALSMNYPHDLYNGQPAGSDNDSIGLFQQRISGSWATNGDSTSQSDPEAAVQRLLNPVWTAQAFFGGTMSPPARPGMLEIAPDWESRADWGSVAQEVQVSAYPDAYNSFKTQATQLVEQHWDSAPAVALVGTSGDDGSGNGPGGPGDDSGSSSFTMPLPEGTYEIGSDYGPRMLNGQPDFHNGQDFPAAQGTAIHAVGEGEVTYVGLDAGGWGNYVVIDHTVNGKTLSSLYAHQVDGGIKVAVGDRVSRGQAIGAVGNTGNSFGAHLHLEIWDGGYPSGRDVDPMPLLNGALPGGDSGSCTTGPAGAPPPFPGGNPDQMVDDPTSNGQITARTMHLYEQARAAFPNTGWACWSPRPGTVSEHPLGRACDITFGNSIGERPNPQQLDAGWTVTNWMKDNAEVLGVEYLIWQGQIWSVARDSEGWRPYGGGGMHDPSSITGGHYDHLHVTVRGGA